MIRVLKPGRALEMAVYEKSQQGVWSQSTGVERAFGLCAVTPDTTKYTHHWLMSEGLIKPENITDSRKVVIKALDDFTYGPPSWATEVLTRAEWVTRQRENWTILEGLPPEDGIACEWIKSNVFHFTHKPQLSAAPPFPPSNAPSTRQIDDGSIGVYYTLDGSQGTHVGELFVSGSGSTRSEIWVLSDVYAAHIPPGSDVPGGEPFITLGPTTVFASEPASGPQDFLDRAWAGVPTAETVALVSATIYDAIPEGSGA
jgi:hypothetical protein